MISKFIVLTLAILAVVTHADEDVDAAQAEDVQGRARVLVSKQVGNDKQRML